MKIVDELVARALVGTQRQASGLPTLPEDLVGLTSTDTPAEEALLDAAAVCTIYSRCGATASTGLAGLPVSEPDERPECSNRAEAVLGQLLDIRSDDLLKEWLAAAAGSGHRPPHRLLPLLLDRAADRRDLRVVTEQVIDRRGHWLAQLNPRWQFAQSVQTDGDTVWQNGTRDERLAALGHIRGTDPSRGRRTVADTWAADPADDRVRWLGVLRSGLSTDDEVFLDSCLDDRSSRVREAAADLLAHLPESRLMIRMTERLHPLFVFTPSKAGSILKFKAKQSALLSVALPTAFDKTMLRDGMIEKPIGKIGQKQWWLIQMLGCVPPDHWSNVFRVTPEELITAIEPDFVDVVVTGWRTATARHTNAAWATALANCAAGSNRWSAGYLAAVPEADRPSVLARLATTDPALVELGSLLAAWSPLTVEVSRSVVAKFTPEQLLAASAAARLHPSTLALLEPGLTELSAKPYVGRSADEALNTITLRRTIHTEFSG